MGCLNDGSVNLQLGQDLVQDVRDCSEPRVVDEGSTNVHRIQLGRHARSCGVRRLRILVCVRGAERNIRLTNCKTKLKFVYF